MEKIEGYINTLAGVGNNDPLTLDTLKAALAHNDIPSVENEYAHVCMMYGKPFADQAIHLSQISALSFQASVQFLRIAIGSLYPDKLANALQDAARVMADRASASLADQSSNRHDRRKAKALSRRANKR